MVLLFALFFFFKQKTAYEMRISDWSSDVCSSDLQIPGRVLAQFGMRRRFAAATLVEQHNAVFLRIEELPIPGLGAATGAAMHEHRRDALRIAAFLDMDFVQLGNAQAMVFVRLAGRICLRHERKILRMRKDEMKLNG